MVILKNKCELPTMALEVSCVGNSWEIQREYFCFQTNIQQTKGSKQVIFRRLHQCIIILSKRAADWQQKAVFALDRHSLLW